MAIRKISGNILQDNLQRGANLSIQGNLVYFDIANDRVGILNELPADEFDIAGTARATDVRITSTTANTVLYVDNTQLVQSSADFTFDGSVLAVTDILSDRANLGNLSIDSTTISSTLANSAIVLSPNGNSQVVIDSTSGLVLPTGATAERPATPDTGTVRYNSSIGVVEVYNGAGWEGVGSDVAAISQQVITGDNSTTVFALDQETTSTAVIVSTNGVVQSPDIAYTVTGNSITFDEAPLTTDVVDVRFISDLSIVTAISNPSGNNAIAVDNSGVANLSTVQSLQLPSYTVTEANNLSNTESGQLIYCSNGDSGSPCLAVYSIDAWKIVSLSGNISS